MNAHDRRKWRRLEKRVRKETLQWVKKSHDPIFTGPYAAQVPMLPTIDMSTPVPQNDAPGVDDYLERLAENFGPSQPVYSGVEINKKKLEAEELLRRLND